jgi:dTDP-4-dehydrorhamnose reductase
MKILVTGSNGLLGQKIIYSLRHRSDIRVIATSAGENRLVEKEGYEYESLDISDAAAVIRIVDKHRPSAIINTAAMTNVDACEAEKEKCRRINVDGVAALTEACRKHSVHLVHLSTDFVFDGEKGPYREEDVPNPLSYYGQSKYDAEQLIRESGIQWAILRTIIIYGIADSMSRSNVVLWAKGALEKGQSISVVDDQFRSPTLAEDLADACISAALKGATGMYHVSGREIMSILELVHRVADFYRLDKSLIRPVKSDTLNQPARRPPYTGFIIEKAERELDYKPHTFEEGLRILTRQLGQ